MTREEEYKNLTDAEFKIYSLIRDYNEDRDHPRDVSVPYLMDKTGKSRSTMFDIKASLRVKGLI